MKIGKTKRVIEVEPAVEPVPLPAPSPAEPEPVSPPATRPELVPAR